MAVGIEPEWKVEKQPAWLVAAIRKTIAALPGGYAEAAEILDETQNSLFNRLRAGGNQIFPMGWAMVLQRAAGVSYIADAYSRETDNGIHVPGAVPDDENEEIGLKLAELVGRLGELVNAYGLIIADDILLALMLLVGHWFENREQVNVGNIVTAFPFGFESLLQPYRFISL
ncbi:hypothetical protein DP180_13760 [Enterobacter kobei]|uniref:head-tail connector protein n=1 Tax=Enterobacter kobei TaxID=208224 RepID=UPI000DCB6511|nr:head-tail connector protein [Enterobacter kobei]RAY20178.1 hypothetical protein DP180_13760 [Enterobacter kobei]